MNSYAAAVGNMQVAAQEYERRCREFEMRARNALVQAERDAQRPPSAPLPVRHGLGALLARVVGRLAVAR